MTIRHTSQKTIDDQIEENNPRPACTNLYEPLHIPKKLPDCFDLRTLHSDTYETIMSMYK